MHPKHFFGALFLGLCAASAAVGRDWSAGLDLSFTQGAYTMPYRLYLPIDYDSSQEYPLVVFLHGAGERGTDNQSQVQFNIGGLIDRTYDDYPAILVAPQLPSGSTSWTAAYDLTPDILKEVQESYSVDDGRVYLTGLSLGGYGTTQYAYNAPETYAAIAPLCGAINIPPSAGEPISETPTWLFHGGSDGVVNVSTSRNYFLDVTGSGSIEFNETFYQHPTAVSEPIRYTQLQGYGHNIWNAIYSGSDTALYDWMFAQRRFYLLYWDQLGDGNWTDIYGDTEHSRWLNANNERVPDFPDTEHDPVVRTDTIAVTGDHSANTLTIQSGEVDITSSGSLTVAESVNVAAEATVHLSGALTADRFFSAGTHVVTDGAGLSIIGEFTLDSSLDMTGATLATIPGGTNITINPDGALTTGQTLVGAELNVAGSVQTAGADVTRLNLIGGGTLSSSGPLTAEDVNLGGGVLDLGNGAPLNVATMQVSGGTLDALDDVTAENMDLRDGTVRLGNNAHLNVTTMEVSGGTLSASDSVTVHSLNLSGGTVNLHGGNLNVATMQVSGGTVDTGAGHIVIGNTLKIGDHTTISISGGTFHANSANLADPALPDNLTLSGGRLAIGGGAVAPTGPIAVWKFEEQDGSTAGDSSTAGNDHPGTLNGATWAADDPEHLTVLRFDDDDPDGDYVEIANTGDIELGDPFTVAMWIKTSQKGVSLLGKGHGDHNWRPSEKALYIDPAGGQLKFTSRMSGEMHGTTNVADDRWHQVVVTYNGGNAPGDQEIYVDGVRDTVSGAYGGAADDGQVFRLGWSEARIGGSYPEYVGLMDDVYLYDRSLIAAEVADLHEAFTSVLDPLPSTNLWVTADSALYLDTASEEATLGNLTLDSGVNLEVTGAAVGFHNVTAGEGSSIEGDLSVTGTLSPGDSPGTFSVIGDLTLPDGSIYEWELGPGTHDLVALEGDLTLADGWTLRLADAGGTSTPSEGFDLFTYTGTYTGLPSFDGATIDGSRVEGSGRWDWSEAEINVDGNRVYLTGLIVVPEPATTTLAAIALLGFLVRARRGRRRA